MGPGFKLKVYSIFKLVSVNFGNFEYRTNSNGHNFDNIETFKKRIRERFTVFLAVTVIQFSFLNVYNFFNRLLLGLARLTRMVELNAYKSRLIYDFFM